MWYVSHVTCHFFLFFLTKWTVPKAWTCGPSIVDHPSWIGHAWSGKNGEVLLIGSKWFVKFFLGINGDAKGVFNWYRCFYPHPLRELVSPVCGLFRLQTKKKCLQNVHNVQTEAEKVPKKVWIGVHKPHPPPTPTKYQVQAE